MKKIKLCGRGKCCPTIEKDKDEYIITDDYGGIVRLSEKHLEMLKESDLSIL